MVDLTHLPDPWSGLRQFTAARIALGRAGASLPTAEVLDFALAHAAARDAVHAVLDVDMLKADIEPLRLPVLVLATLARDRLTYLQRPDLGRRLDEESRAILKERAQTWAGSPCDGGGCDVAFIIADGLSAPAAQRQAPALLARLAPMLMGPGLRVGPICIVRQARVAVEDEIGQALGAKVAVILIGERPGLGTAESLGAYLVFDPRAGRTDAQRNCISNIRPGGLNSDDAARTLNYLITESIRRRISGVGLKDERPALGTAGSVAVLPDPPGES
jgi:ethanolamine ammonia-lyase small subunit